MDLAKELEELKRLGKPIMDQLGPERMEGMSPTEQTEHLQYQNANALTSNALSLGRLEVVAMSIAEVLNGIRNQGVRECPH